MPFIQLVGDQPVYALILEVKNENPREFDVIIQVLGSFHTQMAIIAAMYRRFKGSGLEDLVAGAGEIVEPGSVDQALNRKHYKRGTRLHKVIYECLARLLISTAANQQIQPETLFSNLNLLKNRGLGSAEYSGKFDDLFTDSDLKKLVKSLTEQTDIQHHRWQDFGYHTWKWLRSCIITTMLCKAKLG